MWRPTASDVALLGLAAAGAAVLAVIDRFVWLDWAFLTIVLTALALVVRMSWRGGRDGVRERRPAGPQPGVPAAEGARPAGAAEGRPRSPDIENFVPGAHPPIADQAR